MENIEDKVRSFLAQTENATEDLNTIESRMLKAIDDMAKSREKYSDKKPEPEEPEEQTSSFKNMLRSLLKNDK